MRLRPASAGEDGFVAEHDYEHDDGDSASAGGGGEAAGDGTAGAGGGSEDDRDAVVHDAGQVAEVDYGHAAEARTARSRMLHQSATAMSGDMACTMPEGTSKGHMEVTFASTEKMNGKMHMEMTTSRQPQPIVMDDDVRQRVSGGGLQGNLAGFGEGGSVGRQGVEVQRLRGLRSGPLAM